MSGVPGPKEENVRLDFPEDELVSANVFPLSSVQESLWFREQMSPGTALHNLPEAWRLRGLLHLKALRWAITQIVTRHEALRTAFSTREGQPIQVILPPHPVTVSMVDLSAYHDMESRLHQWLADEACRPFDLSRGPLLRTGVFRLGPEEHVLFVNTHHLVSDAWSQAIFMRELAEFYSASVQARAACVPELPIQYADYAVWQREGSGNASTIDQLNYWRSKLQGPLSAITLPTDHNRPAIESHRGTALFEPLPQPLVQRLKEIGQGEASTLFVVLLAAFKTLLHRYTRCTDIIVGAPMSGRERMETEGLIGLFVNTHALRTELGGDPTFVELLTRVRQTVVEAYQHQAVPLDQLMRALQPDRDPGRHPLFPVVFGLQASSSETWSFPGLSATPIELDNGTSKFDWTLLLTETSNGCRLRSEYSTDLFTAETATRFVHQFQVLLQSIATNPHQRISELPLLMAEERERLLESWNQTASPYERNQCVHEVFETQVAKTPDAPALIFEGRQLSYQEVNHRANQLARRLASYGVGTGTLVGVALEKSFDLIIALLATLKVGAAYVPFDRTYPQERLTFMFQDSAVSVLITDGGFAVKDFPLDERRVLCLDRERSSIEHESTENLPNTASPEELAYAIYTSGSTGKPKAAAIPHRGVLRLVRNPNYIQISPRDTFLQLAPVSFDASTFEIWGALLNGSKLVLCGSRILSLEELGRKIEAEGVTILWLTAGLFHQMVDCALPRLRGVRYLLAGGEVLSVHHVLKALHGMKNCQLVNGYGPTENTTFTCCYPVPRDWADAQSVPIGRPVANTQVYILDSKLQPVPIGVPGELCTGGDGLARGYLNQPELTAEKFVTSPFSTKGERLYRTGDLVRWLSDGNIEFLGRIDEQIKIRGHRVEPREIELALLQHPTVREAFVVARRDKSHSSQLIAYVILHAGYTSGNVELREFLNGKLPHFEIPSHFVALPQFPLTPNGKMDRRALPEPELVQNVEPTTVMPRSATEKILASIWGDLLGRQHVGVYDNFFHLGGHSLLAMQVISRISNAFGTELPVVAIFESPTISALAERIDVAQHDAPQRRTPATMRATRTNAAEVLARMDELTDEQVAAMLRDPELKAALL
jgi:aspartate racemase